MSRSIRLFIFFWKITFFFKNNFYDFVFCDQEKPIGDKRGTFWKFMSLGEEIIEPFYRDPRHSEGDFFQFYYRPFLHIAIFTINSTERCFLVYNLYDKCIKWFQTHLLFKLILACKISSQTPVMNFLHDGVHISYIRIHVRYVPL